MEFLLVIPVLLFSVVVHEVAHARQALREGDPTARDLGRITLNPIPHLDLMGSFLVPLALFLLPGDFLFGWARPVPVNPRNYRDPRGGDIRVSLAGIVSNLGLVALFALALAAISRLPGLEPTNSGLGGAVGMMLTYGLVINLILAWFNLLPIPPLDGSHVLYHLLPRPLAARYREMGRYGITLIFLTLILLPNIFTAAMSPVFMALDWILGAVG